MRAVGTAGFALLFAAGMTLEVIARRGDGRLATLPGAVHRVSSSLAGRLALFAFWAFAGWHSFVR